jgi:hypothetical protein
MMIRPIGGIGGIAREGEDKARHSIIFRPVAVGYFSLGATLEHLESRERGEDRTVQARQVIPEAASALHSIDSTRRNEFRFFIGTFFMSLTLVPLTSATLCERFTRSERME